MKVWRGTHSEYQRGKAMPSGLTIGNADLIEIDELPELPPSIKPCLGRVSISDEFGNLTGCVVIEKEADFWTQEIWRDLDEQPTTPE